MKKLLLVALLTTGCASTSGDFSSSYNYKPDPRNFSCPVPLIALCEGRNYSDMECSCIDMKTMSRVFDNIM